MYDKHLAQAMNTLNAFVDPADGNLRDTPNDQAVDDEVMYGAAQLGLELVRTQALLSIALSLDTVARKLPGSVAGFTPPLDLDTEAER